MVNQLKRIYNYFLEKISRWVNYPLVNPRGSDLILTYNCNFQCAHCDIWQEKNKMELTTEEWLKIIKNLRVWLGKNYLVSVGGGEPLLRQDIFVILDALVKSGFRVILESNGFLMDEEKARKIIASGIEEFRVSLYSFAPEIHNSMRNIPGAQEKAAAALLTLKKIKQQTGSKMKIGFGLLLNEKNIGEDAQKLIAWAKENDLAVTIQALDENFKGGYELKDWYAANPLWPTDKQRVADFFDWLVKEKNRGNQITNSKKTLLSFQKYFLQPEKTKSWPCRLDFRTFNIDPTGRPFFCYKTGILGESFLGNGGKKLWQSESFRAKRELVKTCDKICRLRCYYRDNFWDKILG